jgi:hypothetical protein
MENKIQFRYFVVKMLFQALYLEIKPLKSLATLAHWSATVNKPLNDLRRLKANETFI